jgi:hypothetical protein
MGFQGHQGGWSSHILPQVIKGLLCLLGPLELVLFLRSLKKGSPLTPSHEMNLLKAAIPPPHQLLDIMETLVWLYFSDNRHLL